jgi:nicotinate phosphoribosyltransferase
MKGGRRIGPSPSLPEIRARAAREFDCLLVALRFLQTESPYPVEIADALVRLAGQVDSRLMDRDL